MNKYKVKLIPATTSIDNDLYISYVKFWWFPLIWFQIGGMNFFFNKSQALDCINKHKNNVVYIGE